MSAAPFPQGKPPLVLVVDDVEANRSVICRRLEDTGYRFISVESGEKALRVIESDKPDIVLLDYMMPKMSGIDVLEIVRNQWGMVGLPIIMVTARAEAEAVVEALEAGADDYISKPIDFDVLKARIETQLARSKSTDGLRRANAALDERVAMRVLAFDELREELEREITLRKRLESEIIQLQNGTISDTRQAGEPASQASDLERARSLLDVIVKSAKEGKPINLALLTALRTQIGG